MSAATEFPAPKAYETTQRGAALPRGLEARWCARARATMFGARRATRKSRRRQCRLDAGGLDGGLNRDRARRPSSRAATARTGPRACSAPQCASRCARSARPTRARSACSARAARRRRPGLRPRARPPRRRGARRPTTTRSSRPRARAPTSAARARSPRFVASCARVPRAARVARAGAARALGVDRPAARAALRRLAAKRRGMARSRAGSSSSACSCSPSRSRSVAPSRRAPRHPGDGQRARRIPQHDAFARQGVHRALVEAVDGARFGGLAVRARRRRVRRRAFDFLRAVATCRHAGRLGPPTKPPSSARSSRTTAPRVQRVPAARDVPRVRAVRGVPRERRRGRGRVPASCRSRGGRARRRCARGRRRPRPSPRRRAARRRRALWRVLLPSGRVRQRERRGRAVGRERGARGSSRLALAARAGALLDARANLSALFLPSWPRATSARARAVLSNAAARAALPGRQRGLGVREGVGRAGALALAAAGAPLDARRARRTRRARGAAARPPAPLRPNRRKNNDDDDAAAADAADAARDDAVDDACDDEPRPRPPPSRMKLRPNPLSVALQVGRRPARPPRRGGSRGSTGATRTSGRRC